MMESFSIHLEFPPQYQKGSNHIRHGTGDSFTAFIDILHNQAVQIDLPKLYCEERSQISQCSHYSHISSDFFFMPHEQK